MEQITRSIWEWVTCKVNAQLRSDPDIRNTRERLRQWNRARHADRQRDQQIDAMELSFR